MECKSCKYWNLEETDDGHTHPCVRFPPPFHSTSQSVWCGEYEAKEEPTSATVTLWKCGNCGHVEQSRPVYYSAPSSPRILRPEEPAQEGDIIIKWQGETDILVVGREGRNKHFVTGKGEGVSTLRLK